MKAPERDVVRVLELEGPRGGQMYVLILSCGCYLTSRKPKTTARCISCFVRDHLNAEALSR